LAKMREKVRSKRTLVTWRTAWAAHMEFVLMLRFDDLKRLTMKELSFEENENGKFIRLKLIGKTNRTVLRPFLLNIYICRWQNNDVSKEPQR